MTAARRPLVATFAVATAFGGMTACTSTVTPPVYVEAPVTVFLLSEAMHSGIVLPPTAGGEPWVEFGFGDWSWFALGNDAWYHVFATVLWPTQATLGRRTFVARDENELRARAHWAELSPLVVSQHLATRLRHRLQKEHDDAIAAVVRRADLGWDFVPLDRSYWCFQTCADVAAGWFRELDCEVGWAPIRVGLAVAPP